MAWPWAPGSVDQARAQGTGCMSSGEWGDPGATEGFLGGKEDAPVLGLALTLTTWAVWGKSLLLSGPEGLHCRRWGMPLCRPQLQHSQILSHKVPICTMALDQVTSTVPSESDCPGPMTRRRWHCHPPVVACQLSPGPRHL